MPTHMSNFPMFGLFAVDYICFWIIEEFKVLLPVKYLTAVVVLLTFTTVKGVVFYKNDKKSRVYLRGIA